MMVATVMAVGLHLHRNYGQTPRSVNHRVLENINETRFQTVPTASFSSEASGLLGCWSNSTMRWYKRLRNSKRSEARVT